MDSLLQIIVKAALTHVTETDVMFTTLWEAIISSSESSVVNPHADN
jgi:hypothetical protein